MNKKSIKIILCIFIILGILAITKNVYAETTDMLHIDGGKLTVNVGETIVLTVKDVANKMSEECPDVKGEYKDFHNDQLGDTEVSNIDIAAISIEPKKKITILGKADGKTTLAVCLAHKKKDSDTGFYYWEYPQMYYELEVIDVDKRKYDAAQEENDKLLNYYKTPILDVDDRLMYLRSILYNETEEHDLWRNFVNETTKSTRKQWFESIIVSTTSYIMAGFELSDEEKKAIAVLATQIEIDAGKEGTQEKLEEVINEGHQSQKDAANNLKTIINSFTSSQRRTNAKFTDVLKDIANYIPKDSNSGNKELEKKASIILTVITDIGIVISIIMLAIIGIKYMLGSVEEKAEYKQEMIPYLVGSVLVFGISAIVKLLQSIGNNINNI